MCCNLCMKNKRFIKHKHNGTNGTKTSVWFFIDQREPVNDGLQLGVPSQLGNLLQRSVTRTMIKVYSGTSDKDAPNKGHDSQSTKNQDTSLSRTPYSSSRTHVERRHCNCFFLTLASKTTPFFPREERKKVLFLRLYILVPGFQSSESDFCVLKRTSLQ